MRKFLTTLGLTLTARPLFASGEMYHQNYNPLGNVALSTIVAAVPIVALLYFIALHPHRDKRAGRGHRSRHGHVGRRSLPWTGER